MLILQIYTTNNLYFIFYKIIIINYLINSKLYILIDSPGHRPRLSKILLLIRCKPDGGSTLNQMSSNDKTCLRWTNMLMEVISGCELASL
jgi:hypothetical protein